MPPFRFRLQKVLELRKNLELDAAIHLAAARTDAQEAERARGQLEDVHEAGLQMMAEVHGTGGSAGQLQNLSHILNLIQERILEADAECAQAQGQVDQKLAGLTLAMRERELLVQLRERQRLAWSVVQADTERKQMDEIALGRHLRTGSERAENTP